MYALPVMQRSHYQSEPLKLMHMGFLSTRIRQTGKDSRRRLCEGPVLDIIKLTNDALDKAYTMYVYAHHHDTTSPGLLRRKTWESAQIAAIRKTFR